MTGIVTEEIKKNTVGEVKVDGKKWSAISDTSIKVDEEVVVEKIDGVKLIVKKEKITVKKSSPSKKTTAKKTTARKRNTKNKEKEV